jgi:hypothetical protein
LPRGRPADLAGAETRRLDGDILDDQTVRIRNRAEDGSGEVLGLEAPGEERQKTKEDDGNKWCATHLLSW